jgi:CBS domain-containing protein
MADIAALASGEERGEAEEGSSFFGPAWEDGLDEEDMEDLHLDLDGLRVASIMNPRIYSVREDATVSEIASMMLKGHLHRLLVTREDRAVGIITTSDLLGLLVGED